MPGPGLLFPSAVAFSGAALFGVGLYVGLNWDTIRDKAQMIIEENKARWADLQGELYGFEDHHSDDEVEERIKEESNVKSDAGDAAKVDVRYEAKPKMEASTSDSAFTSSSFVYHDTAKHRIPLESSSSSLSSSMHSRFTDPGRPLDSDVDSGLISEDSENSEHNEYSDYSEHSEDIEDSEDSEGSDDSEDLGVISMDSEDYVLDEASAHSRQSSPGLI